ncbi:MAG: potassium-transporting ATPase subunit KdpA [Chlamydiales bacterium]|nr:potassium-transporting ATPase subunit KdpA [Chlamydiales bacterium]
MQGGIEFALLVLLLLVCVPLVGSYMAKVFDKPSSAPGMGWSAYARAMLCFNGIGLLFLFVLQLLQGWLPLNPQGLPGVGPSLAFNTAISFVTNTNWQAYGGETTMSYLTQTLGLGVQNFVSAATGNAILLALIRGLRQERAETIGNFWIDLSRMVIYVLLPLSILFAVVLASQGVIQSASPYIEAVTLEGEKQVIPMGMVASQVAIKQLGTNGGGYFNANSSHPFENPTPLTNFLELFAILLIPTATTYMYGVMIGARRQGIVLFIVMAVLWLAGVGLGEYFEASNVAAMEGKEVRLGVYDSVLWSASTTATSNGSVNAMSDSLSPVAGGVSMFNMMIGEVVFGGVGVGLCGMLMFVLLTVFLSGLMVGRTPEYLGKKIEKREMQWTMLALLAPAACILLGSAVAVSLPTALASLTNAGPHGLSEMLYAFTSAAANNGSSFAGLNANTTFFNVTLGLIMLLTRLAILIPSLAIAGSLAGKQKVAPTLGTFTTDTPLFASLLLCVIFIVAALTFFPALSLGPIVEQLLMLKGRTF